jgi:3'-5' exonuclease
MASGSTSFRSAVPLSVLQIWVSIISTFAKIGHFKGNLPAALWTFLENPQILKAGQNVTQDLKQLKNESQPPNSTPDIGGIELAKLVKERGVISDAQLGLAQICAVVLGAKLDKTTPVQVSSNWDDLELSAEQLEYAALDPLASLKIYHWLSTVSAPEEITDKTLPGTHISVYQEDGQVIAHGVLSCKPHTASLRSVNHLPTCTCVTIQEVLIPAVVIHHYKTSLSALGPAPFDILVKSTKLCSCAMLLTPPEEPVTEPSPSTSAPTMPTFPSSFSSSLCWNNFSISYSSLISSGLILFLFFALLTLSWCI